MPAGSSMSIAYWQTATRVVMVSLSVSAHVRSFESSGVGATLALRQSSSVAVTRTATGAR